MTAKEYLSQARSIEFKLKIMAEQLQSLKDIAENVTSSLDDMPKAASPNIQSMEDAIVRMVDLKDIMRSELSRLAEINDTISTIPDPFQQAVLVKRYLKYLRWSDVALELHISKSHVYRLHNNALIEIEKILKSR